MQKHDIQVGQYYLVAIGTYDGAIEYRGTYLALVTRIENGTVTMIDAAGSDWENQDDLSAMATDPDVHPVASGLALEIRGACLTHYLERMLHSRQTIAQELPL